MEAISAPKTKFSLKRQLTDVHDDTSKELTNKNTLLPWHLNQRSHLAIWLISEAELPEMLARKIAYNVGTETIKLFSQLNEPVTGKAFLLLSIIKNYLDAAAIKTQFFSAKPIISDDESSQLYQAITHKIYLDRMQKEAFLDKTTALKPNAEHLRDGILMCLKHMTSPLEYPTHRIV